MILGGEFRPADPYVVSHLCRNLALTIKHPYCPGFHIERERARPDG